ncbi:hypothetical protein Tco_1084682 [Tanacetum coccineum]
MTKSQQGNENLETTQEQVVEDAHVTISTVTNKTEVPVTSSSCSSDLALKFLKFSDIPHTDAEIVSPLDVPVYHEVLRTQAPTLLSIPIIVIPESSSVFTNIPQSSHTFTPTSILATPTPPPKIQTTNPLSNPWLFICILIQRQNLSIIRPRVKEEKDKQRCRTNHCPKKKDSTSGSSKGTKSQSRSYGKSVQSEEPVFEVANSNMPPAQEGDMGDNEDEPRKETASRSDWFKKPTPVQEPTDPD